MNIQDMKNAIALIEAMGETATQAKETPRNVIIRSRVAGVVYGRIVSRDGADVVIENGRQMWKWFAAEGHTLIDVAKYGVDASKCKFSPASANITLVGVSAIIDVTDTAAKSIEAA